MLCFIKKTFCLFYISLIVFSFPILARSATPDYVLPPLPGETTDTTPADNLPPLPENTAGGPEQGDNPNTIHFPQGGSITGPDPSNPEGVPMVGNSPRWYPKPNGTVKTQNTTSDQPDFVMPETVVVGTQDQMCMNGICRYQMLAPIAGFLGDSQGFYILDRNNSGSLSALLNSWFRIAIALAGLLAVVQIVIGGFKYATTEAMFGKSDAKERIQNALYGLMLALVSYLILNTINPALTRSSLFVAPTQLQGLNMQQVTQGAVAGAIGTGMGAGLVGALPSGSLIGTNPNAGNSGDGSIGENIASTAEANQGYTLTCMADGSLPGGVVKNCANAVNKVVFDATGEQAGGGASTEGMYNALRSNPDWELIPAGLGGSTRGDVVVEPNGHAGIVTADGGSVIMSNSSYGSSANGWAPGTFQPNYTRERWERGFPNSYVFRKVR